MSAVKLRNNILKKLDSIDDECILSLVVSFLDFESNDIYKVSPEQNIAIVNGISEIERGEFITDEELRKETNAWLKK